MEMGDAFAGRLGLVVGREGEVVKPVRNADFSGETLSPLVLVGNLHDGGRNVQRVLCDKSSTFGCCQAHHSFDDDFSYGRVLVEAICRVECCQPCIPRPQRI
jgi:hypothetical protein